MLEAWAVGRPGQEPHVPPTTVQGSSETLGPQTWETEPRESGEKGKEMNILNKVFLITGWGKKEVTATKLAALFHDL